MRKLIVYNEHILKCVYCVKPKICHADTFGHYVGNWHLNLKEGNDPHEAKYTHSDLSGTLEV